MMPNPTARRPSQVAIYFNYSVNSYCYIPDAQRKPSRAVPYSQQGRTISINDPVKFPEVDGPYAMKRADLELPMKHMDIITM